MRVPVACTVAGADPSGGAGLQADLRSFAACGVHGASVVTAVTVQDTAGVRAVEEVSPAIVAAQIDAVAGDMAPGAWKTGMLGGAAQARAVAARLRHHRVERLVVDPVMLSTSGHPLLGPGAELVLRDELVPLALVVTPNHAEAEALTGVAVAGPEGAAEAGRLLVRLGARIVVVTGGHGPGDEVVDVVVGGATGTVEHIRRPRVGEGSIHGTGCALSAAITARLALGDDPLDAVRAARDVLQAWLVRAVRVGSGRPVPGQLVPHRVHPEGTAGPPPG